MLVLTPEFTVHDPPAHRLQAGEGPVHFHPDTGDRLEDDLVLSHFYNSTYGTSTTSGCWGPVTTSLSAPASEPSA